MVSDAGSPEGPVSRQERVLLAYTAFWLMAERLGCEAQSGLGGKLVASLGFGYAEAEIALGATIAGAAFLGVDAEAGHIKRAMRLGCCDFMVNTLDEAVRALKNEVRKRRPVSVGLLGNPASVVGEMVERGLLPDILAATCVSSEYDHALDAGRAKLREMGVVEMEFALKAGGTIRAGAVDAAGMVATWSDERVLHLVRWSVGGSDAQAARKFDERLLADLPAGDTMRRRWLQLAPKYFRKDAAAGRAVWMSDAEELRVRSASVTPLVASDQ